ncbi:MAG: beta-propeller fold lactonase family protein [Nocardioidaceae bacterium]|nr:beta-propeller fold lactonase family protein [Nocardioidaceae bacterium]
MTGPAVFARKHARLGVGALSLLSLLGLAAIPAAHGTTPVADNRASTATTATQNVAARGGERHGGAAFAMTNDSTGNEIISYRRGPRGDLTRVGSVSTRGTGIGTDLDTQGALVLSEDNRYLYAANAGSDNVSVFAVNGPNLTFLQKIYAGDLPNSLTLHGDLLYALDGSVAGNGILGFRVADDGTLSPLRHSFRLLSSPIAVPGQIQFSPDGRLLVVTQKTTNVELTPRDAIDVFRVGDHGRTSAVPRRQASFGLRPFSLAFRNNHDLLVVESFNAAPRASAVTSYEVSERGVFDVTSGSIPNRQTDACWIVITRNGHYAYTANFGSGTISSYRINDAGETRLLDGNAAFLGIDSQPVDLALRPNSRDLYLLLRGTGAVATFKVQYDGGLTRTGVVTGGLPVADGASGLAVY